MLQARRAARASIAALATLSLAFAIPSGSARADDTQAQACVSSGKVWVLVDLDGSISGGCASKFSSGREALISAGFTVTTTSWGGVGTINGAPAAPGTSDWWSYWNNTPGDDGAYAGWSFYKVGDTSSAPKPGSVEGWRLWHSFTEDAQAPTLNPVAGFVLSTASPTPATASPTPATATPSPTQPTSPVPTETVTTGVPSPSPTPAVTPGLPGSGN